MTTAMPAPVHPLAVLDDERLQQARLLSTATLHEAYDQRGALPSSIRPIKRQMNFAGRALPVRCPLGDNLWIHKALVEAQPDDVLVVDAGDGREYGYWGEVMATMGLSRGIAGLVITGGVRDTMRLIELGLPTFSAGIAILGTAKNPMRDGAVGEPVRIGETVIRRGDLVVGDADGIFVCAVQDAAHVLDLAEERDRTEVEIIAQLRSGATTMQIYGLK